MQPITIKGFQSLNDVDAGAVPMLQWLKIEELVVDPSYQRPIVGSGRRNVERIARSFSWCCFTPVVVSPVEGGRFAIIDGQHRTTAAMLVGFDKVPCQIVVAAREQQAAAFKAINCVTTPIARVAVHAAAFVAGESWAVQVANVCARADAVLLRYPIPISKQVPGQTMAVGAIKQCIRRYGETTVITALQCVTETCNNRQGMLNARMIKALCAALALREAWREGGLSLFEAFDQIDLDRIQTRCAGMVGPGADLVQAMADAIAGELAVLMPDGSNAQRTRVTDLQTALLRPSGDWGASASVSFHDGRVVTVSTVGSTVGCPDVAPPVDTERVIKGDFGQPSHRIA